MSAEELDGGRDLFDDSWMADAACRGLPADMFFPERGDAALARKARSVCMTCPVRVVCLEYAIATKQHIGVWGGYGSRGRDIIKRRRERATTCLDIRTSTRRACGT